MRNFVEKIIKEIKEMNVKKYIEFLKSMKIHTGKSAHLSKTAKKYNEIYNKNIDEGIKRLKVRENNSQKI